MVCTHSTSTIQCAAQLYPSVLRRVAGPGVAGARLHERLGAARLLLGHVDAAVGPAHHRHRQADATTSGIAEPMPRSAAAAAALLVVVVVDRRRRDRDALDAPAGERRLAEPEARQRRDHQAEGVAVAGRSELDDFEELDDRAGPAVGEQERQRARRAASARAGSARRRRRRHRRSERPRPVAWVPCK